jgi:hypothetical protein
MQISSASPTNRKRFPAPTQADRFTRAGKTASSRGRFTNIGKLPPVGRFDTASPVGTNTPVQIARACLAAAHDDAQRAIALAGKFARGATLRAVIMTVGTMILRGRVS